MKPVFLALALVAGLPLAAHAQWQPTAELGVVNTTGNSDTTSVNGKFALSGEDESWTHDYYLAALRAESGDDLTANRAELGAKAARKLGDIYGRGAGDVPRDYEESIKWYEVARSRGVDVPKAGRR